MENPEVKIEVASVKVMRSFDYCHFEISLTTSFDPEIGPGEATLMHQAAVDELRKTAARLVDKAVEQYKVAKANVEAALNDKSRLSSILYRHRDILNKAETDRTPEEKALVKAIEDKKFRERPRYDYENEWDEPDYSDDDSNYEF